MNLTSNILIVVLLTLVIACNKEENQLSPTSHSTCEFVENMDSTDGILDESEIEMIRNCRETQFTTKSEIEANLKGEWELVGFGDGWLSNITQPCAHLTISNKLLIFEFHNEYLDTVSIHQWEIENNLLKVTPEEKHLSLDLFCEQYIHGSFTEFGNFSIDVDQYIYKKVK